MKVEKERAAPSNYCDSFELRWPMFTRAELSLTQRLAADFDTTTTMATVHPSRMGLIPQEMRGSQQDRARARSPSPRRPRRSPSPRRSQSRERERGRDERQSRRDRDASNDRGRDSYRDYEPRRASPKYDDYKRAPPPVGGEASAPWRQPENMYPARRENQGHGVMPHSGGSANAGFMER